MTVVHMVYPHGSAVSAPDAIGRNLSERLEEWFDVRRYDWRAVGRIRPGSDDVLLGHPHPASWTIFRRSARLEGWRRVIVIAPFNTGQIAQVAFLDSVIRRADVYLAITGNNWLDRAVETPVAHWLPRMGRLDLAVDRRDFPRVKGAFNEAGSRRFVYIGNAGTHKNLRFLREIARAAPRHEIAWVGGTTEQTDPLLGLGRHDFSDPDSQRLIGEFDFLLNVSSADANPTTILEAMAWGLVPVCTPESGYVGYDGIVNVPLDDVAGAVAVLDRLQKADEHELLRLVAMNDDLLDSRFSWDRFAEEVRDAILADGRAELGPSGMRRKLALRYEALSGPYSMLRARNFLRFWGSWSKRTARGLRGRQKPVEVEA